MPPNNLRLAAMVAAIGTALLAISGIAIAGAPLERGRLEGRTAQGEQIVFHVAGGNLRLRHFTVRLRCRDDSVLIDRESDFQTTALGRNGSFRDDQAGGTDEVRFQGQLRGRAARGRLRVRDRLGRVRCDSRWVRFTARAGRPARLSL